MIKEGLLSGSLKEMTSKVIFSLTLTHISSYSHTASYRYRYTCAEIQAATVWGWGVISPSSGPLGQRRQHLPLLMQDLICEENVCLCKESKKIIVTAYVTGAD